MSAATANTATFDLIDHLRSWSFVLPAPASVGVGLTTGIWWPAIVIAGVGAILVVVLGVVRSLDAVELGLIRLAAIKKRWRQLRKA